MLSSEDKTELPSPKRLKDALDSGNVIVSREVYNFFAIFGCFLFFAYLLPSLAKELLPYLKALIANSWDQGFRQKLLSAFTKPVIAISPVFLLFISLSLLANFLHHRKFTFSFKPLVPNLGRISLIAGFKRLFSKKTAFEGIKILIKLALVGCAAYFALRDLISSSSLYFTLSTFELLKLINHKAANLVFITCLLVFLLAGLDYLFQMRSYIDSMKMTKRELLEEHKNTEGSPQVKGRIRARMAQFVKGGFNSVVEKSDLVILDSGNLAVVLKYDAAKALRLRLKGKGKVAVNIEEAARSMQIPIIKSKVLASSLYVQVGVNCLLPDYYYSYIPESLDGSGAYKGANS